MSQTRFEYTLARDLKKTHAEMMHSMSEKELQNWGLLYEVEAEEQQKAAQ